jgi:chromosome segregation ATPase
MSEEFNKAYQEILLENATAIIKQNFLFQTQLKLSENLVHEKNELEKIVASLKNELATIGNLRSEVDRLQYALNDSQERIVFLSEELRQKNEIIVDVQPKVKPKAPTKSALISKSKSTDGSQF